ncbi:MAG: head GIN domain-containing protein [Bacteroidales bacterium]
MKKLMIVFLGMMLCHLSMAQKTETRAISTFDKLEVFGNVIVELTQGTVEKLVIESEEIEMDKINTRMDGKTLRISMGKEMYSAARNVRILLTYVQLYEITSKGGADVKAEQPLKADRVVFNAATGGNIYVDLEVKAMQSSVGQGSLIVSAGKCTNLETEVNSGGVFSGFELECETAVVQSSSKGKVKLNVSQSLDANANTGGWVGYLGNPAKVQVKTNLGGKVEKAQEEE